MTDPADYTPAQVAAFDQARATEMKKHTYKYGPDAIATCACGEEVPLPDIGVHIDTIANAAGTAAANAVSSE